ncbi:MAG: YaaA family protein [Microbacteriaceae bacterium]
MIVLLPPSETKRDGGVEGTALDLSTLSFVALTSQRVAALAALAKLSANLRAATGALSLGPSQRGQIERNRSVAASPTMPAIERYTGVLYDGLDAVSLGLSARQWLDTHVVIQSALFGLVRASDAIPAYRLSHNSKLPGLRLKAHWGAANTEVLAETTGLILDLRSEAYASLGPMPERTNAVYVRVVTQSADSKVRALNHFNKKGKGEFVRALAQSGLNHVDVASLISWAQTAGIRLEHGKQGELELYV